MIDNEWKMLVMGAIIAVAIYWIYRFNRSQD